MVARQAAAAATAPESREPPAPSIHIPNAAKGVNMAVAPVMTHHALASTPPTTFGSLVPDLTAVEAERERALAALTTFKRFNPPTFDGEVLDP